jgi:hypothetical protein
VFLLPPKHAPLALLNFGLLMAKCSLLLEMLVPRKYLFKKSFVQLSKDDVVDIKKKKHQEALKMDPPAHLVATHLNDDLVSLRPAVVELEHRRPCCGALREIRGRRRAAGLDGAPLLQCTQKGSIR